MKRKQLEKLGIRSGDMVRLAIRLIGPALKRGLAKAEIAPLLKAIAQQPADHTGNANFGALARALVENQKPHEDPARSLRSEPAPWRQWGSDLDEQAIQQMRNACEVPVAVAGALMPDAHVGYGLPIGGVLATENAVIPYAVGVDIACRMKMTVFDMPPKALQSQTERLIRAIESETRFGIGAQFRGKKRDHAVMDENWNVTPITRHLKDKAHAQLGTSGSGNHFVEFGLFSLDHDEFGLKRGIYLSLLSHSGSRGAGAKICDHYSRLAMDGCAQLPKHLRHLAWLDLRSHEGIEYWSAMQLMGKYAAANHALIHRHIARHLGVKVLLDVENHHNFAWKEVHGGREMIVHRKGATPAGAGVLGVIPGSMATPGYVVRGKASDASLHSASHGAGRVMSRKKAKQTYRWSNVKEYLKQRGVRVLSAGLDEVPMVYKDIDQVMGHQEDLVEIVARFDPKLVKMAPAGERPED